MQNQVRSVTFACSKAEVYFSLFLKLFTSTIRAGFKRFAETFREIILDHFKISATWIKILVTEFLK